MVMVVYVTMLNAEGKLLQCQLNKKTCQDPQTDFWATARIGIGYQMQDQNAQQIRANKRQNEL